MTRYKATIQGILSKGGVMITGGFHFPRQQFRCNRLMLSLGLFISFLFLVSHTGTAHAARTLYVAPAGSDSSNSCLNSSTPCKTVNYAIANMVDGDTLKVSAGNYSDSTTYTCASAGQQSFHTVISQKDCAVAGCTIEVQGTTGSATWKGASGGLCVDNSDGWTIRGLKFEDVSVALVVNSASKTVIEDSEFLYYDIYQGTPLWITSSNNARISRSVFENKIGCNVPDDGKALFKIKSSSNIIFEQSRFGYDNTIGGINTDSTNITLRRNIFTHFTEHGIQLDRNPSKILIENNIFRGDPACVNATVVYTGPRIIDVYEVDGLTVRNNTVAGHGYMWQHWLYLVYTHDSEITQGCTNGICHRQNIRVYNNLVYDIMPIAKNWVNISYNSFTTQNNIFLDGNLYFNGAKTWTEWLGCGGDLTWSQWKGCSGWDGTNNIDPHSLNVEPSFANYAAQDYRPAGATSPQVNAGVNGTDSASVTRCALEDFNGNARTDGTCDIGAFEFGSGGADKTAPVAPRGLTVK